MELFLYAWEDIFEHADSFYHLLMQDLVKHVSRNWLRDLQLLSPVPGPRVCVMRMLSSAREAARKNRGLDMIPSLTSTRFFYFTNHNACRDRVILFVCPTISGNWIFELETAVGYKPGKEEYYGGKRIII